VHRKHRVCLYQIRFTALAAGTVVYAGMQNNPWMHMNRISVRPADERDRGRVIAIFNYYVSNGFAAYPDTPMPPAFYDILRDGSHSFYVVEKDGDVIGFALMKPFLPFSTFSGTATVSAFIAPAYRRSGCGTMLLDAMTRDAKSRGISVLLASISSKNPESRNFHKKHGFVECGRLHNVGRKFGERFDVVWMEKELEPFSPRSETGKKGR
jgi:phosphinothricin acetyltransferase